MKDFFVVSHLVSALGSKHRKTAISRMCVFKSLKRVKLSSPVKVTVYFRCILKCHRKAECSGLSVSRVAMESSLINGF